MITVMKALFPEVKWDCRKYHRLSHLQRLAREGPRWNNRSVCTSGEFPLLCCFYRTALPFSVYAHWPPWSQCILLYFIPISYSTVSHFLGHWCCLFSFLFICHVTWSLKQHCYSGEESEKLCLINMQSW